MQESILTDFAILGIKLDQKMDLDTLRKLPFEILEHYSPMHEEIPDYLQNLNVMCFIPPFYIHTIAAQQPIKRDKNYKSQKTLQQDYLHQFVMTDAQGQKRYCSSQVVYEKIIIFSAQDQAYVEAYVPFSYCLISSFSNLQQQKNILSTIYGGWLNPKQRDRKRYMQLSLDNQSNIYSSKSDSQESTQVPIAESLEFILSLIFSISIDFTTNKPLQLVLTPQEKINKQEQTTTFNLINFQTTANDPRFQLADVDYKVIFSRLSINNILKVLQYLLLDKQIMLFTDQVEELSSICESLLSFLQPFQWGCLYIPYLPVQLLDTFHATVPYIIGVHSDEKFNILKQVDKSDKIIVHLNEDKVIGLQQEFPDYVMKSIERELKSLGFVMNKIMHKIEIHQVIQLKHVLFKHFMQLVNNCVPYFTYSEEESQYGQISEIFQIDQYIQLFPSEEYIFYNEFIRTMIFSRFIEDSYKILYHTEYLKEESKQSSNSQLAFFLRSIKRLNQKKFFNMVENKNLYSAMQIDFESRIKSWVLQQKNTIQIECGDLYGPYKKKGRQVVLPLIKIDKNLIILIPQIFKQKQCAPVKTQKTEYKYIQASSASHIQQSSEYVYIQDYPILSNDENKLTFHWKNKSYNRIHSVDSSRIKDHNYQQASFVIPYPKLGDEKIDRKPPNIRSFKKNKSISEFKISENSKENFYQPPFSHRFQATPSRPKQWIQELKQQRMNLNLPVVKIDLFDKLFNDISSSPSQVKNQYSSAKSNRKIFTQDTNSVQRFR